MARTLSDEELQLRKRARRRLIGAIALVTAVAVVLPMVLDSEPQQVVQDVNITIPSPDSGAFTSKVAPVAPASQSSPDASPPEMPQKPDLTAAEESKSPAVATAPEAKPAATAAVKEASKPAEKQETAKTPGKAPPPKETDRKTAKAPAGQFVVQVVALADADRAKQMQRRISGAGIKSYTEVVKTVKGDVTRVRAGPFVTREAAEKAQKQLKAIGLEGKVVPKSP